LSRPISVVVVDARGLLANLGADATTATALGLDPSQLPQRALGAAVGVHVYVWRGRTMALGIGAETLFARTREQPLDATGEPLGPVIERRLSGLVGSVSLNFGSRAGWSYVSGGIGPVAFATFPQPRATSDAVPSRLTQHAGGGARWFTRQHLAVGFDVRFYLTRPQPAEADIVARDRQRVLVVAIGISLR
jgi:hypothetical protein